MSLNLSPSTQQALDLLETQLSDPSVRPRTEDELIAALENLIGGTTAQPQGLYVPNAEAPITVQEKEDHIQGPLPFVEPRLRALSQRAHDLVTRLVSLTAETATITAGLSDTLKTASARIEAARSLSSSSRLHWMSSTDKFLDLQHVDPSLSTSILVETATGNGVSLSPQNEQDLTENISRLTLVQNQSGQGIPGDNMELSGLQGKPGIDSPAAGSSTALSAARQNAGASGGTGQEPTVSFAGIPDLHADLSSVLSADTGDWFDWECLYVPPVQKCSVQGTAYVADSTSGSNVNIITATENYGWTASVQNTDGTAASKRLATFSSQPPISGRDGPLSDLHLVLEIDMGQPVPLNQIAIVVKQTGGLWPSIQGVDVSLDRQHWQPLRCQGSALQWQGNAAASVLSTTQIGSGGEAAPGNGAGVKGGSLWEIPSYASVDPDLNFPSFQYVSMTFVQPDAYLCPKGIGHPYYIKVTQTTSDSKAIFGLVHHHSQNTDSQRLPTPESLIGVNAGQVDVQEKSPGKTIGGILGAKSPTFCAGSFCRKN